MNKSNDIEYKITNIIKSIDKDVKIVKSRDGTVLKFERDGLDYSMRELSNGLRVMFIEDDHTVQSQVHMSVSVGHQNNPPEFEGLAHFLEHMLFIGSKKYPDVDLYSRVVSDSHGSSNAYTADDHTAYFFDCQSDLIFNVLDIFCQFFVNPLLDPKYVDKEVTAVDHEHQKNIGSDTFRKWSLIDKFITDDVNSRFRTGSVQTLKVKGVVEALRKLYETYYTVDRMLLVVVHNKIDDEFINQVSKIFSAIPKKKTSVPIETEIYPVGLNRVGGYEIIRAKRMKDGHSMMVRFFFSDTIKNNAIINKGYHVLAYILNHRGRQSIYKLLIDLKLIRGMFAAIGTIYTNDTGFDVGFTLTDYGFRNYQSVIQILMGYLNRIRQNSEEIFDTYYEEMHRLDILAFNTMDRFRGVMIADSIIDNHNTYRTDLKYIRVFDMLDDPNVMRRHFIDILEVAVNEIDLRMKVILMSKEFDDSELDQIDPHYLTRYNKRVEKFSPDDLSRFYGMGYTLPELNPYIPDTWEAITPISSEPFVAEKTPDMSKIDDPNEYIKIGSEKGNYYHLLKTNNFDSHHAYGDFTIVLSSLSDTLRPIDALILEFYIRLVTEEHKPEMYLSSIAGSSIGISSFNRGLTIGFRSFDSSVIELIETHLNWYFKQRMDVDRAAYSRIFRTLRDGLLNFEKAEPYTRLHQALNEYINPGETISNSQFLYTIQMFDPKMMEDDNSEINFKNLQSRAWDLMKKGSVRGVIGGSIHLATAQRVVKIVDGYFEHQREFKIRRISNEVLNNLESVGAIEGAEEAGYTEHVHSVRNKNENDQNIAISYNIHLGEYVRSEYDPEKNPKHIRDLLAYFSISSMLRERFFNAMRTENELGYYVRAGVVGINSPGAVNLFLKFEIQTQENNIVNIVREYVDQEVMNIIHEFDEDDLNSYIKNMVENLFSDPVNMSEKLDMASSYQSSMTYEELDKVGESVFLNRLRSLDLLKELQKLDLKYVHSLLERALSSYPRYRIMVLPMKSDLELAST